MLNCYGQHKAAEAQRTAASASERYAADERVRAVRDAHSEFIAAEHAKNVAAEARMRRRQERFTAPNLYSRDGLIALLILACYFAGVFALAYFLGN